MKTVVGISLGAGDQDFEFKARFLGERFNVRRLGTNGSTAKAVKLLRHWEQQRRRDRPRRGQGQLHGRLAALRREGQHAAEGRRHARARSPPAAGWPTSCRSGRCATCRPSSATTSTTPTSCSSRAGPTTSSRRRCREYTQNLAVRRPAAAARRAQAADLARHARALRERRALRARLDARPRVMSSAPVKEWTQLRAAKAMQEATVIVAPVHELDDFGARGARRQDHRHLHRQRRAHRAVQATRASTW